MVTDHPDNLDLAVRRIRLGLSQAAIAERMGRFHFSELSRFEHGQRDFLPARARGERKQTRADYERVLDELEAERAQAGAA